MNIFGALDDHGQNDPLVSRFSQIFGHNFKKNKKMKALESEFKKFYK